MRKICVFTILILLAQNCSNKLITNEKNTIENLFEGKTCQIDCKSELICYKFLYNDDYSIKIDEKSFWGYGHIDNGFAIKKINNSMENMIKSIRSLEKKDALDDFTYTYAFINNCKDTIYTDYTLNKWIIKETGKSYYYEQDKADTLFTVEMRKYDKFFKY